MSVSGLCNVILLFMIRILSQNFMGIPASPEGLFQSKLRHSKGLVSLPQNLHALGNAQMLGLRLRGAEEHRRQQILHTHPALSTPSTRGHWGHTFLPVMASFPSTGYLQQAAHQ